MRRQLLAALGLGLAARQARAQCTLPAPPENTQFVQPPGGTPDCAEGEVIANGESCDVACAAGYGQGGGGSDSGPTPRDTRRRGAHAALPHAAR